MKKNKLGIVIGLSALCFLGMFTVSGIETRAVNNVTTETTEKTQKNPITEILKTIDLKEKTDIYC